MLVDNSIYKNVYKGNGVTTEFPISFPFLENSHVQVVRSLEDRLEEVVPATEYAITGAGAERGGTCIFTIAPPTGTTLAIVRNVPITQLYAYEELDSFPAESHEDALAKLTMICQMLAEQITRAIIVGATDDLTPEEVLEDFFTKYNVTLELYEKIQMVIGNLFTCSIVPFTTIDGQTQYSVGTELPLDPDANNLLLSLGGVLQEPDVAYKILDSSHIEFTSNPGGGLRCWGRTSVSFSNPDIRSIIENAIKRIEEAAQAQIDRIGAEIKDFADGETIIIDENGKFSVPVFTPPTADTPGKAGLVPAPEATPLQVQPLRVMGPNAAFNTLRQGSFDVSWDEADSKKIVLGAKYVQAGTSVDAIPYAGDFYCDAWNVPGISEALTGLLIRRDPGTYGMEEEGVRSSFEILYDLSFDAIRFRKTTGGFAAGGAYTWSDWDTLLEKSSAAPVPTASGGVGQWIALHATQSGFPALPRGGTWACYFSGNGPVPGAAKSGGVAILPGGSKPSFGSFEWGTYNSSFVEAALAWRIA